MPRSLPHPRPQRSIADRTVPFARSRTPPACAERARCRWRAVRVVSALVLGLVAHMAAAASGAVGTKPNVLFIVSDDHGYGEMGVQPHVQQPPVATPHLDRLAREGIRLTQAYSNSHVCAPSRAAFLTGRYPHRFGFHGNGDAEPGMPRTEKLLPAYFKEAGYATAAIGKWHLGWSADRHPQAFGFDEFFGFLGGEHSYFDAAKGHAGVGTKGSTGPSPILDGRKPVSKIKYLTEELTDRTLDFIRRHRNEPFCVYLAYNAVHSPMEAPAEYLKKHDGNARRAMLASLDDNVGRVLERLRELGLERNTVVVFHGDNGGSAGADNGGLRGQKGTFFEGGIRVPAMIRWPERLPAGRVYDGVVIGMDVLPTLLAAAGIAADRPLDGFDLLPLIADERPPPERTLHWLLGRNHAVRSGAWKFVHEDGREHLFDVSVDPAEKIDVAARHPDMLARLQAEHAAWLASLPPRLAQAAKAARPQAR